MLGYVFGFYKFKRGVKFYFVDLNNLVLFVILSCGDDGSDLNEWDDNLLGSDIQLPIGKLHVWVLKTVPNLPECLVQFVYSRLSKFAPQQVLHSF